MLASRIGTLALFLGALEALVSTDAAMQGVAAPARVVVPRLWAAKELADWATPVAGLGVRPGFVSEEEYYAAPVDNLRTYPVYHPDWEPEGYRESLVRAGPQRLIEPDAAQVCHARGVERAAAEAREGRAGRSGRGPSSRPSAHGSSIIRSPFLEPPRLGQ